jgi:trk system potassium uptake protein TrkA
MRVIICGAGQVGSTIAGHLASEGIDVTVLDLVPEVAQKADESYDVRGMVGHASHPEVLERAGARGADMLIAVTASDEVNIVACQIADAMFGVRRRIARLRHPGYHDMWRRMRQAGRTPIDVVISPELEVARGIARRLKVPGAFDMVPLAEGKVQIAGVHCAETCPLLNAPLRELRRRFEKLNVVVLAIVRKTGEAVIPRGNDRILPGDDVYLVTESAQLEEVLSAYGHHEVAPRRIVIVGGGNVGFHLARQVAREAPQMSLKIIEQRKERADFVSRELGNAAVVLHGDVLDKEMIGEANIRAADTLVAVTNDDETNIFASVMAKREGCLRAITLVNKAAYAPMLPALGIDGVVSPRAITISSILRHVRHHSIAALYTPREDFGEVIEVEAQEGSRLVSGRIQDIGIPKNILIGAIVRNGEIIIPTGVAQAQPGDHIVAMVGHGAIREAERMIAGDGSGRQTEEGGGR